MARFLHMFEYYVWLPHLVNGLNQIIKFIFYSFFDYLDIVFAPSNWFKLLNKINFDLFILLFFVVFSSGNTTRSIQSTHHSNDLALAHHNHSQHAFSDDDTDQLVKPLKIHTQPLHEDDLLYESMKFDPNTG